MCDICRSRQGQGVAGRRPAGAMFYNACYVKQGIFVGTLRAFEYMLYMLAGTGAGNPFDAIVLSS